MLSELNILKSLDHPNIVRVFECFQEDEQYIVVTEYVNINNEDIFLEENYSKESRNSKFLVKEWQLTISNKFYKQLVIVMRNKLFIGINIISKIKLEI